MIPKPLLRQLAHLPRKAKREWEMRTLRRGFGLDDLDLKILPFLRERGLLRNGFFIEAGANDGITQSNTLLFEKYLGWRGLLVEPVPRLAVACAHNRPRAQVENCALVPFDFPETQISMCDVNLMSVVRGALCNADEEAHHIRTGAQIQNITPQEIQVPAQTLTSLLEKHAIKRVDWLSLDVEGFELSVLRGLDFNRFAPQFLLIEARYRAEIDDFLLPRYRVVAELTQRDVLYEKIQL